MRALKNVMIVFGVAALCVGVLALVASSSAGETGDVQVLTPRVRDQLQTYGLSLVLGGALAAVIGVLRQPRKQVMFSALGGAALAGLFVVGRMTLSTGPAESHDEPRVASVVHDDLGASRESETATLVVGAPVVHQPPDGAKPAGAEPGALPPLTEADVSQVLGRNAGTIHQCHQRALQKDPDLNVGQLDVTIVVMADGNVGDVTVDPSDELLAPCIAGRVRGWKFRASSAGLTTTIPIKFSGR